MLQKKICMLGTFAVGKTSLVRRFVESIYEDKYHTTIGIKTDKKVVQAGGQDVMLMLWDVQGEESAANLRGSYLRGASGYLLVADGTRNDSLYTALSLQTKTQETIGEKPFLLLLNKADLTEQWSISERETAALEQKGWRILQTSAKSGANVEEAFLMLAQMMTEV